MKILLGMQGIDEEFALLQTVRADPSVNWKKITANSFEEAVAPLKELAKEMLGVNRRSFAPAFA